MVSPDNQQWYKASWRINDNPFVGKRSFDFRLDPDKYYNRSLTATRLDRPTQERSSTMRGIVRRTLTAAAVGGAAAVAQAAPPPPNILLILADDVGAEAFGSYGGGSYQTPNINELARTGLQFNHAYACPLCTPSRVELLTGKYNFRNYESFSWLSPQETTFTEVLRGGGYTTAIAGKWQLSSPARPRVAAGQPTAPDITAQIMRDGYGFDHYSLWQLNGMGSRYWDPVLDQDGQRVNPGADEYGPAVNVQYLNTFMKQAVADKKPFVAYYAMELPHNPWVATPDGPTDRSRTKSSPDSFAANIAYLDKQVGQLVAQLDTLGVRGNTLVIFTSDNGTGGPITSQTKAGSVQGDKGQLTDAGTHVPFILNWPGKITAGSTDHLMDFSDIMPTLLEVAGVPPPAGLTPDGRPLIDAAGKLGQARQYAYVWYDPKGRPPTPGQWARDQRYKLYGDGQFFDMTKPTLEKAADNITPGTGSPEAEAARARLQKVLDHYAQEEKARPSAQPRHGRASPRFAAPRRHTRRRVRHAKRRTRETPATGKVQSTDRAILAR
ncbi:MAG: sulfatase-like hydrolase/transferase [Phycisphaeraceae bacterium]